MRHPQLSEKTKLRIPSCRATTAARTIQHTHTHTRGCCRFLCVRCCSGFPDDTAHFHFNEPPSLASRLAHECLRTAYHRTQGYTNCVHNSFIVCVRARTRDDIWKKDKLARELSSACAQMTHPLLSAELYGFRDVEQQYSVCHCAGAPQDHAWNGSFEKRSSPNGFPESFNHACHRT